MSEEARCPFCVGDEKPGCEICAYTGKSNPWEQPCSRCEGMGYFDCNDNPVKHRYDGPQCSCHVDRKCSLCGGSGVEITDAGDILLAFLQRHLDVSSSVSLSTRW